MLVFGAYQAYEKVLRYFTEVKVEIPWSKYKSKSPQFKMYLKYQK